MSFILALKLSRITFSLKELKMSRLLHFEALDYPIKGQITKKFWKYSNKIAHGVHYNPIFGKISLGVPQCIHCSNNLSTSEYLKNDHIFISNNDIQSQSVSFCKQWIYHSKSKMFGSFCNWVYIYTYIYIYTYEARGAEGILLSQLRNS